MGVDFRDVFFSRYPRQDIPPSPSALSPIGGVGGESLSTIYKGLPNAGNCHFNGWSLQGKAVMTIVGGRVVWEEG